MLSHTAEYALRAVISIARHGTGPVRVGAVATDVGAPQTYLAKILSQLAKAGVLDSARGPAGGFRLAIDPDELPLARIVAVFAGEHERRCLLGTGICGANPECPAHSHWSPLALAVDGFFDETTVAEFLRAPATIPVPPAGAASGQPRPTRRAPAQPTP